MKITKIIRLRYLPALFLPLVLLMLAVTLYPFNFRSLANDVERLADESGLYFNGQGIAYTDKNQPIRLRQEVSVELWLQERRGSKNWGAREIFSFYDGGASPSLLVGQWGRHIFLYSRFDPAGDAIWYKQFRTRDPLPRDNPHLITVTFGPHEKAIYVDGELHDRKIITLDADATVEFSGILLLGNSPTGKDGWWGEIKGLALSERLLSPSEVESRYTQLLNNGMDGLNGCAALYTFSEPAGMTMKSMAGASRPLYIPAVNEPLFSTMLSLPNHNMKINPLSGVFLKDFLENIFFFMPFGAMLAMILARRRPGVAVLVLAVTMAGGLFSFAIEFIQLYLPTRTATITDVISNMTGSGLGSLLPYLFKLRR
jgi:VanZ family protein